MTPALSEAQGGLEPTDWKLLIDRIQSGKCIPIIGPEVCKDYYPAKSEVAQRWAEEEGFPFPETTDLSRVAQFLEVKYDQSNVRERLIKVFNSRKRIDFSDEYEPHRVLAKLDLPLYITTSYDSYMYDALKWNKKDVLREHPNWGLKGKIKNRGALSAANPVVLQLYGHTDDSDSLVLTERDYIQFLINFARSENEVMPLRLQSAIVQNSLLFVGYQLDDWDFRFLLAFLNKYFDSGLEKQKHVSAQIAPLGAKATAEQRQKAQDHFKRYLDDFKIRVYWGPCEQFLRELWNRIRATRETV
jgi:hypothetical protein